MAAHINKLLSIHPEHAGIVVGIRRGGQKYTKHMLVASRLSHQAGAHVVVIFLEILALGEDVAAVRIRDAAMNDTSRLTFGMGINDIKKLLVFHWYSLRSIEVYAGRIKVQASGVRS